MTITTYILEEFNSTKAEEGCLCVATTSSYSGSTIANGGYEDDGSWKKTDGFLGVGVCRKTTAGYFSLIVDSVEYLFTVNGTAASTVSSPYKLWIGKMQSRSTMDAGSVISSTISAITTRTASEIKTRLTGGSKKIIIDSLFPRDQFAMQALRSILEHTDKSPSSFSDNEMQHYCDAAYQWAANMMNSAADARATMDDQTSGETHEVKVYSLENNTEKLLNNISNTLSKTTEQSMKGAVWRRDTYNPVYGDYTTEIAKTLLKTHDGDLCDSIPDAEDAGWVWTAQSWGYNRVNVDKIPDSLVTAIQRTDKEVTVSGNKQYYKKIASEELAALVKPTPAGVSPTTVGIADLILAINTQTSAITDQTLAIEAQTTAINELKVTLMTGLDNITNAITALQPTPSNNVEPE